MPLASSLPDPYPLEGLSAVVPHRHRSHAYWVHEYTVSSYAVASIIQSLVAFYMHTLKHVTIEAISFFSMPMMFKTFMETELR